MRSLQTGRSYLDQVRMATDSVIAFYLLFLFFPFFFFFNVLYVPYLSCFHQVVFTTTSHRMEVDELAGWGSNFPTA